MLGCSHRCRWCLGRCWGGAGGSSQETKKAGESGSSRRRRGGGSISRGSRDSRLEGSSLDVTQDAALLPLTQPGRRPRVVPSAWGEGGGGTGKLFAQQGRACPLQHRCMQCNPWCCSLNPPLHRLQCPPVRLFRRLKACMLANEACTMPHRLSPSSAVAAPPLQDLCLQCLSHWRRYSLFNHPLTPHLPLTPPRYPILCLIFIAFKHAL